MPPTKNISSVPSFVEALKHGHRRKTTNLDLFEDTCPRRLGVNDKFIPYLLLNLRFVPMFLVKNFVIAFNPNGPKQSASKEVPYFDHFAFLFGHSFPKQNLFPIEGVIIAHPHPTKFMHNERGSSPCPPCLDAIPKIMFN